MEEDPRLKRDALLAQAETVKARREEARKKKRGVGRPEEAEAATEEAEVKEEVKAEVPPPPNLPVEEPAKAEAKKKPAPGEFEVLEEEVIEHAPSYQPKFLTPEFLHAESDSFKIIGTFIEEADEMDAKKIDAQTRLDFWQDLLNTLNEKDQEYDHKKNLIEKQLQEAQKALVLEDMEKGMEKGREEAEALLGPKYEPKFLTLKKFREEPDMKKYLEALRFEDGELAAQKIDFDQRINYWERLLAGLESGDPLHGAKEAAVKVRLERARGGKTFAESLERGTEEFLEQSEEAREAKFASRVLDIMGAEGVSETEARRRAEQEINDEAARDKERNEKLEKLKEARESLAKAEKNKKAYEGLVGRFKGWIKKDEKSGAEAEYIAAKESYDKARAEYVAGSAERMLKERADLADARAREFYEKRGKIYRAWKWLGEQNVEKLMPDKWKAKLASWRPEGKLGKVAKFGARLGTKFLSLRTGVSFGLLGVGIWGGVGTAAAVSLFAARRALGGVGAGFGTYDLLRRGQESWAVTKWNLSWKPWEMKAGLTKEDVENLSEEELEERMAHFEMNSAMSNSKVSENKVYSLLAERYKELVEKKAEEKGADVTKFLEGQMEGADGKLKELQAKAKRNKKIMMGIALGMGLVAGSGLISKLIHGKWGWEKFAEARAAKTELRQQIGQAPETPHEAPPVGPVEAVSPSFSAEDVATATKLPKEFIAQLAGPDGRLTPDEIVEIGRLRDQLVSMGLNPEDAELIKGLHIEKISDIATAEANLVALHQATSDAGIAREVVARGLDEGDAGQLRSVTQAAAQAHLTPEASHTMVAGAVENNFENNDEVMRILSKVDSDHLKLAGILKPDGTYDYDKFREIVNAHTITIDQKGEGIYKALRDYYSAPLERGGLGLSGRELRAKIVEQMRNPAFFKNGKLQDLVELGDQIRVDGKGNVLLFVAEDGKMARTRDILDLVSDRAFRSGNQVFEVAPGVHLHEAANPIDGHAIIKLTDAEGHTHTIADWSVGRTARIDGHKEVLEDWLRRNNLLAGSRAAVPPVPPEELGGASQARHDLLVDEPRRLSDEIHSASEARAVGDEATAATHEAQAGVAEESTGVSHEAAEAAAASTLSPTASEVLAHAAAYDNALPHFGIDIKVEDIAGMSPEELQNVDADLSEVLEGMPETGVSDDALHFKEALQTLQDYLHEQLEGGGGAPAAAVAEVALPEAATQGSLLPEVFHSGEPVQVGDLKVAFQYDVFGNPSGVAMEGAPSSLRAESLLHADWAARLETTAVGDLDGARADVMLTARELELRERLLEGLERAGQSNSPEAEFLRRSTKMLIENKEEEYGDVFRD